jgi:hypothetical protein
LRWILAGGDCCFVGHIGEHRQRCVVSEEKEAEQTEAIEEVK